MNFHQVFTCVFIIALALLQQNACKEEQILTGNINKPTADDLENYLNEIEAEKLLLENLETENEMLDDLAELNQYDQDSASSLDKRDGSKRNSNRRQQAARWDIGFGKRDSSLKLKKQRPSQFFDSLYGKRSMKSILNPKSKYSFGRRQQWDIQYGK